VDQGSAGDERAEQVAGRHDADDFAVVFDEEVADVPFQHQLGRVVDAGMGVAVDQLGAGDLADRQARVATCGEDADQIALGHDALNPVEADDDRPDVVVVECPGNRVDRRGGRDTYETVGREDADLGAVVDGRVHRSSIPARPTPRQGRTSSCPRAGRHGVFDVWVLQKGAGLAR